MKRIVVLSVLLIAGSLSITVAALQQPPAAAGPKIVEVDQAEGQPLRPQRAGGGRRRQQFGLHHGGRRGPRRHQESRLGPAAARRDQEDHRQAGHHHHQHAYPRRSRQRQRRVRRQRADHRPREHRGEHEADAAQLRRPRRIRTPPNIFRDHNGKGLPKRTFGDTLTLGRGAEQIDLLYFGRAHTNGDIVVLLPGAARAARRRRVPRAKSCRSWTRTTAAPPWATRTR